MWISTLTDEQRLAAYQEAVAESFMEPDVTEDEFFWGGDCNE